MASGFYLGLWIQNFMKFCFNLRLPIELQIKVPNLRLLIKLQIKVPNLNTEDRYPTMAVVWYIYWLLSLCPQLQHF